MSNTTSYPVSTIAKLFDLTERRVQQLAAEGVIPKASKGKYELVPCVKGYINYLKQRSLGEVTNPNIATERARLLKMQADKLAMEIDEEKGRLLDAEKAARAWDNLIARCRAVLLGIPNRLANQVIAINNAQEAAHILKQAIYEALEELSTTENTGDPLDETHNQTKDVAEQNTEQHKALLDQDSQ